MSRPLGRRTPSDFDHVAKWGFAAISPKTVATVNKTLTLPYWHWTHDQGSEGSCVGHGSVMERAITNTAQNKAASITGPTRRYDPIDIWNEAKKIDEWSDTNPGDDNGTSVRAAYDVLRNYGPRRVSKMVLIDGVPHPYNEKPRDLQEGVAANRWATTVDEIRTSISMGLPVTIGVNWYTAFDNPDYDGYWYWIGKGSLGSVRGGHCVTIYGASDKRQAFRVKNSWGKEYPLVWLTYGAMGRLLQEDGEATLITDR